MLSRMNRLALLCDAAGSMVEVLIDDGSVLGAEPAGMPFSCVLTDSSIGLFYEIAAVLAESEGPEPAVALDWRLLFEKDDDFLAYHVCAASQNDLTLIAGGRNPLDNDEWQALADELTGAGEQLARAVVSHREANLEESRTADEDALVRSLRTQIAVLQAQALVPSKLENELIRMAAHDLRNPLLVVQMNCSFLLRRDRLSADCRPVVEEIRDTCTMMNRFLSGMTQLSEVWLGQLQLAQVSLDALALVREVADHFTPVARAREMTLTLEAPESSAGPVEFLGDQHKLARVLHELIGNAFKWCPAGTAIALQMTHSDDEITLAVADDGPGIPAMAQANLFRPFGKTPHPEELGAGAGVGLPIARRLVEAHGGTLAIESSAGVGTRALVRLPRSPRSRTG